MDASDVVLRFLESVGRRAEAEFYLGVFRAEEKERFATIAIDAPVARHALEAVLLDLRFLAGLGLVPVVVLGLVEPADAAAHAAALAERLGAAGVATELLAGGAGAALPPGARVAAAARAGVVPLLPFSSGGDAGPASAGVDDRFRALGELLSALRARKLIVLRLRGGLGRARDAAARLSLINLATDYDGLVAARLLSRKELALLGQARRLIADRAAHPLLVAVTSPLDLLRELFTVKGAGTLIKRGAQLLRRASFAEVDVARLRHLLEASFDRPLDPRSLERDLAAVYLEEGYRGAAILEPSPLGAYLSKFAVEREAQGEGLGRDLWQAVVAEWPTLFWRSRPGNPIASWYAQQCDGLARSPSWTVYWRGLPPEQIPEAIARALAAPSDFTGGR